MTEWKVIPGFPNYEISREGEVRNITTGKVRVHQLLHGYPAVKLSRDGKQSSQRIHRLLMITFVGPCPEGQVCRHIDGSRTNYSLDNLCYGTVSDNSQDSIAHGTMPRGSKSGASKLTERAVRVIRGLRDLGYTYSKLANMFDVNQSTIARIIYRDTWAHVV